MRLSRMIREKRRPVRQLAMALAAVAALVACGDGDDKSKAPAAAEVETPTTPAPSKEAFCSAMANVDAPFNEAGQYASREQKVEAARQVVDLLDDTAKVAPPDIADPAKTKLDAIRTTAEGEPSALIDSATLDATEKIKAYCPA